MADTVTIKLPLFTCAVCGARSPFLVSVFGESGSYCPGLCADVTPAA